MKEEKRMKRLLGLLMAVMVMMGGNGKECGNGTTGGKKRATV